jgi:hypothetical protein
MRGMLECAQDIDVSNCIARMIIDGAGGGRPPSS